MNKIDHGQNSSQYHFSGHITYVDLGHGDTHSTVNKLYCHFLFYILCASKYSQFEAFRESTEQEKQ